MVFDKSRKIIFEIAKIWQRANIVSGVDTYFKFIEDKEIKSLEKEIDKLQEELDKTNKKLSKLKEKSKTLKSAKKEFEETKIKIKKMANDLKNKQKSFSKISHSIKKQKNDFEEKFKSISKIFNEISKFRTNLMKQKEDIKNIIRFEGIFDMFKQIEEIFPFDKLVNYCNLELKIENEIQSAKINNLRIFQIILLESIACNLLNNALHEKLNSVKLLQMKYVCRLLITAFKLSADENFNTNYYETLLDFSKSQYIYFLGINDMENHDFFSGTQYFLKAKEYLEKCSELPIEKREMEQFYFLINAHASDSYNLIYLLNSYVNWKNLINNSNNEIKEIAEISMKNIEEWITKQFGFPNEDKLLKTLKNIHWPQSETPNEIKELKGVF
ncbi:MAG: hypothetical protein ACTSX4_01650 [Candidatus Helarchaeota archaeon]